MAVSARPVPRELGFAAPDAVRETLAALGRTEDVRFSPSGRRLAIACYAAETIALAEVEIAAGERQPELAVTSVVALASPALREPHGLDFVDDDTLVVGNRAGGITVVSLGADGEATFRPVGTADLLGSPGSVCVVARANGSHDVLACNNWSDEIVRHTLAADGSLSGGEVVARAWLDLPDGLAVSGDGRRLAVSNHNSHTVLLYAYPPATADDDPIAVLRGARFPHGLRFSADDRYLLVADAGAPYVQVFERPGDGWEGAAYPLATIEVMDEDTFARGHHRAEEGGPKGLDVHRAADVLVVTSAEQPLAFFDLRAVLTQSRAGRRVDALLGYESLVREERCRREEAAAEVRAVLDQVTGTKAWRLTAPLRRLNDVARRVRGRVSR